MCDSGHACKVLLIIPSPIRALAFSDLHCDLRQAGRLVEASADADVVLAVGDLASVHSGLDKTVAALRPMNVPVVFVPGNNETEQALREACEGWDGAIVLHGQAADVAGTTFFGLGGGIPVTPWDWSFDLTEEPRRRRRGRASGRRGDRA